MGSITLKLWEPEPGQILAASCPTPLPAGSPVRVRLQQPLQEAPFIESFKQLWTICYAPSVLLAWALVSDLHSHGSQRMCLFIYFYYYYFTTTPVIVSTAIDEHIKRVASTRINSRPQIVLENRSTPDILLGSSGRSRCSPLLLMAWRVRCLCNHCHGDLTCLSKLYICIFWDPIFRDVS